MTDRINPISNTGNVPDKKKARVNHDGPSFKDVMRGKTGADSDTSWIPGSLYEGILTHDEQQQRHILIGQKGLDLLNDAPCKDGRIVLRIDHTEDGLIHATIMVLEGQALTPAPRVLLQPRKGPRQLKDVLVAGQEIIARFADPAMAHIRGDALGARFTARILSILRPGEDMDAVPAPPGWQAVIGRIDGREKGKLVMESPIGRLWLESPARPAQGSPILIAIPDTGRLAQDMPVLAIGERSSIAENMDALRRQQVLQDAERADIQDDEGLSQLPAADPVRADWGIADGAKVPVFGNLGYDAPIAPETAATEPDPATRQAEDGARQSGLGLDGQMLLQSIDRDIPEQNADDAILDDDTAEGGEDMIPGVTPPPPPPATTTSTASTAPQQGAQQGGQAQNPNAQPAAPSANQSATTSTQTSAPTPQPANSQQAAATQTTTTQTTVPQSTTTQAPPPQTSAQPVSVSAGAAGLGNGQVVNAIVTGSNAQGLALLQSGGVTLQSQTALPKELAQFTDFQLKIIASKGDLIQAEIVAADGKPLPRGQAANLLLTRFTGPPAFANQGQAGVTAGQPTQVQTGQILNGFLNNPAPGSGLKPGSLLQFQVNSITLSGQAAIATPNLPGATPGIGGQNPGATNAVPGPSANNTPAGQAPTAPPGTAAANRGQPPAPGAIPASAGGVKPAGSSPIPGQPGAAATGANQAVSQPASQQPPASQSLSATVVAQNGNSVVLETNIGTVTVRSDSPLAIGTKLELSLQSLQKPYAGDAMRLAVMGEDARMAALDNLSKEWTALRETLSLLQATSPQAANELLSRMPAMNARLTTNVLFFMNALGSNNIARFTSQAALDVLRSAGRSDLADQLSSDFSQIGRLASESSNNDWRAFMLPFYDGQNLQQVQFYLDQRQKKKQGGKDGDEPTHFVMDLNFSELGPLQLDGMVDPVKDNPLVRYNFDMTLRSRYKLADEVMQHIGAIFYAGVEVGGLTGNLKFAVTEQFPEQPMRDLKTDKGTEIIV